jgi:hypothetical protein
MRIQALLCLTALTLFAACGKKADTPQASSTPEAPASTEVAGLGVPECDDYLEKYLDCIDNHVPEATRAQVRASLDGTRAAWRQAALTPEGKAGLAASCRQATDIARTAMSAYGCTF